MGSIVSLNTHLNQIMWEIDIECVTSLSSHVATANKTKQYSYVCLIYISDHVVWHLKDFRSGDVSLCFIFYHSSLRRYTAISYFSSKKVGLLSFLGIRKIHLFCFFACVWDNVIAVAILELEYSAHLLMTLFGEPSWKQKTNISRRSSREHSIHQSTKTTVQLVGVEIDALFKHYSSFSRG